MPKIINPKTLLKMKNLELLADYQEASIKALRSELEKVTEERNFFFKLLAEKPKAKAKALSKGLLIIMFITSVSFGQEAPTTGKQVLPVEVKHDNEYNLRVYDAFQAAPYKHHLKRLPKKLAKYGFTNVEITDLGMVKIAPDEKSSVSGYDVIDAGGSLNQAIAQENRVVRHEEFQVNFNSDQGFFKVRLNMTATKLKYIIKE